MPSKKKDNEREFDYDVCLSFAGEQRAYVQEVADTLKSQGVRVFYDDYEKPELWGKDLYEHLDEVYQRLARYCILFASADYAAKVWPSHERRSAQARALKAKGEYILPARFDETPIPGLPDTVHYIDLRNVGPKELAVLAITKLGKHERSNYLPPRPDRLFARLEVDDDNNALDHADSQSMNFLEALRRMTEEEQEVVLKLLWHGCPAELPENVHINVDLLRRVTGRTPARLRSILGGLRSLGFQCSIRDDTDHEAGGKARLGRSKAIVLRWEDLSDQSDYPATLVAREMVHGAVEDYCEECGWALLRRLDFSSLATSTKRPHKHHTKRRKARTSHPKRRRGTRPDG